MAGQHNSETTPSVEGIVNVEQVSGGNVTGTHIGVQNNYILAQKESQNTLPALPDPVVEEQYLDYLIRTNSTIDPRGVMQTTRQASLKLDEVYVSLTAERQVAQAWNSDLLGKMERDNEAEPTVLWERGDLKQERLRVQEKRTERVELPPAVQNNGLMVLLGDPGAGKTTLMRFLALHFARAYQDKRPLVQDGEKQEYGETRLPILVRISRYAEALTTDSGLSLRDFLPRVFGELNVERDTLAGLFNDALKQGRALVLLDGLDEVIDAGIRAKIARRIGEFVAGNAGNRFIVTSRIAGYRAAPLGGDFAEFTLRELEPEQIRRFLQKWCPAYERWRTPDTDEAEIEREAKREIAAIEQAVQENLGVKRLAINPLLLTILALIHRNGSHLPHSRVELYEIASKTLLRDWQRQREIPSHICIEEEEALRMLGPVAYWLHEKYPSGMAPEHEVKAEFAALLAKQRGKETDDPTIEDAVRDFLQRVREHTGLFVERAPGQFGFMHLTFEEYFVGREIVRRYQETAQIIYAHRHLPRWEEPILLAIGFEGKSRPEHASDLIRAAILAGGKEAEVAGFAPSHYEDVLHRDLLFAAHCLGDCKGADSALVRDVVGRLVTLYFDWEGNGKYAPLKKRILERLRYLGDSEGGREAVRLIGESMKNKNTEVRKNVASSLGQLGQAIPEALDVLSMALADTDVEVQRVAASALGQLGQATPEVLALFSLALVDDYWSVRKNAASALGQLGQATPEVLTLLSLALANVEASVSRNAAFALGQLGQATPEVLALLAKALADTDESIRRNAASSLERLGRIAHDVLPVISKSLAHRDEDVRRNAVSALGQLGQATPEVLTVFMKALVDTEASIRRNAVSALGQLGQVTAEVLDVLSLALADTDDFVQISAVSSLGQLGQATPEVLDLLSLALTNTDESIRRNVAFALGQLGQATPEVLALLAKALADTDEEVRRVAASTLGHLGQPTPEVLTLFSLALADMDDNVQEVAVFSLGQLGQTTPKVLALLLLAMENENHKVRAKAAYVLGNLAAQRASRQTFAGGENMCVVLRSALEDHRNKDMAYIGGYTFVYDTIWDALWKLCSVQAVVTVPASIPCEPASESEKGEKHSKFPLLSWRWFRRKI